MINQVSKMRAQSFVSVGVRLLSTRCRPGALMWAALFFTTACQPESRCVPGESVSCPCANGSTGAQSCDPNGTFAVCSCDVDAGVGDAGYGPPCESLTTPGAATFSCAGVSTVTLTQLQSDVLGPTCAISGCHVPGGAAPTDYSTVAGVANVVNQTSLYAGSDKTLKVAQPNSLINSTIWLMTLGGTPSYSGPPPDCRTVGPLMPLGSSTHISTSDLNEIKGWICGGAPAQ